MKASAGAPRAVFFDVGDTLLDTSSMLDAALFTALVPIDAKRTIEDVRAAVQASAADLPAQRPSYLDPRENAAWWIDRYRRVADALGLTGEAHERFVEVVSEGHFAGDPLRVVPEAPAALERLTARGVRLGVISNWDDTLEPILERKGLRRYFQAVVASTLFGTAKPSRAIFDHALRMLGVPAEEAWHVGDDPRADALGALEAGLSAVLLDPYGLYPGVEAAGARRARNLTEAVDHILNGSPA
ncbi:MAG: HAD family hydrolase [Candidatus Eiseniibacteriota bacterium]